MIKPQLVEGLAEQFSQFLSGEAKVLDQESVRAQVKSMLQGTFDRLDIVSREEFDAQKAVIKAQEAQPTATFDGLFKAALQGLK